MKVRLTDLIGEKNKMNGTIHRSFECELFENEKGMVNVIDKWLVDKSGTASHFDMKLKDKEVCEEPSSSNYSVTKTNRCISQNGQVNARLCYGESNGDIYDDYSDNLRKTEADDGENEYICDTCNQGFRKKRYLIKHIVQHMDDRKLYKCRFCPKEVTSLPSLRKHETSHTDEKPYECKVCKLSFRSGTNFNMHVKKTHFYHADYICEVCGLIFDKQVNFKRHSTLHTGEKKYECKYCEKSFRRPSERSEHQRTQHQRLPCDKCDLIFSNRTQLKRHRMVHLDRPFKCDQCAASFTQSTNLTKHKVIHLGIKPYKCTLCENAYNHRSNLNKHLKDRHSLNW